MHGGGGNFCVGDVWLRWGKVGLGRCVAAIEWRRQEGVLGKMQWLWECVGCGSVAIDPPPPPNSSNHYKMVLAGCKLNKTIEFFCFSVFKKLHTLRETPANHINSVFILKFGFQQDPPLTRETPQNIL